MPVCLTHALPQLSKKRQQAAAFNRGASAYCLSAPCDFAVIGTEKPVGALQRRSGHSASALARFRAKADAGGLLSATQKACPPSCLPRHRA